MESQYESLRSYNISTRIVSGEASIDQVDHLINKKYPDMWKSASTTKADMVPKSRGGNISSTVKEEYRILERVSPGRYRLIQSY
jgi:hypothetical protein